MDTFFGKETGKMEHIEEAKRVFDVESQAIAKLAQSLTHDFSAAVECIYAASGHIVVSGVGKSGHIGAKIAATLSSTGTPSLFLHPTEALHGDLGMLRSHDVLIAISYSGESDEILRLLPHLQQSDIRVIAISGSPHSTLVREADCCLNIHIDQEVCPLTLAPMASVATTLAMGDALAAALMRKRRFQPEDFARNHPEGSLGHKLLRRVSDVMHRHSLPIVTTESPFQNIVTTMTGGKMGMCVVMEGETIAGIITDGDLRRALEAFPQPRFDIQARDMMSPNPKTITPEARLIEAETHMIEHKIKELLVIEEEQLVGIIQLYDIEGH